MTSPSDELHTLLTELDMRGLAETLDDLLARATKQRLGPVDLLTTALRAEHRHRNQRGLERRAKRSRIGAFKPMAEFDWDWPRVIPRDAIERAMDLRFMKDGANVVLVGAHGLGKTMILKNIAHEAVLAGHAILFVTAAELINDLSSQESARTLERRIKYYAGRTVLCVDELGYLSFDNRAADLLFEVVSRRHRAGKPLLVSTNLAFKEWPSVFPNATCTVALVDRLVHRADIIKIDGESWRKKESRERQEDSTT